ncbi:uncharacterized protein [Watersipora subatra]|uniref:uncharacterized protein isoform X2 n=1 Tax=Watersipora subatra TaxID=2589382 RepID=UPI00355BE147
MSLDLLDIPWFAFDLVERGTPERRQIQSSHPSLSEWEPSLKDKAGQVLPSPCCKQINRKRLVFPRPSSSTNESQFKHHEIIGQYIDEYRVLHAHKNPRNLSSASTRGSHILLSEENIGTVTTEAGVDMAYSQVKQNELLQILRHSHRKRLALLSSNRAASNAPSDDVEQEEGEDDSREPSDHNSTQSKSKLLKRPTSSSSLQSSSVTENFSWKKDNERSITLSAGLERLNLEYDGEKSETSGRRKWGGYLPAPALTSNGKGHRSAPRSKYFVGSTLTKTPQNGLISAQPSSSKSGILRPINSNNSTHAAISTLKHQYVNHMNRHGVLGFGLMKAEGHM